MSILVSRKAPDFTSSAVMGSGEIVEKFNLHENIKGKYAVIFFYPLDFTFVCPSELIALDNRIEAFRKRNVEVIAVSIDSQFTHNAYRNTSRNEGGIGPVQYTMVADMTHTICQAYGVEHPVAGVAFRGAFIINKEGIVVSQIVNDLPIGRNVDEIIRLVDAVQHFDEHGEVCPAGWQQGQSGMKASPKGVADYLSSHSKDL